MLSFLSPFLPLFPVSVVQSSEKIDLVATNIAMFFCRYQISEDLLNFLVGMILWETYHRVVGNLKPWLQKK
jgi:hypothetical protein